MPFSGSAKTTDRVNMRELPMTGADIVKVVPKKGKVEIIGQCGAWYQVKYSGRTGYLMAQYVVLEEEAAGGTETAPDNPSAGETVYASAQEGKTTARVNMRKSPSADAAVAKVLDKNAKVSIVGESGVWYKVTFGGKEGYVSKSYICIESSGAEDSGDAVVPEGSVSYPAARSGHATERVNMRESASTGAKVIKVLNEDAALTVLGEMNGFYQVKSGDLIGYVSQKYVRLGANAEEDSGNQGSGSQTGSESAGGSQSGTNTEGETLYAASKAARTAVKVNMRRDPEGEVLFTLPEGTGVTLIGEIGGWYKAVYSSSTGYIAKAYVSEELSDSAPEQPETDSSVQTPESGTTGYVTGASVNMRKGPGTGYGVIKVLYAGDEITFYGLTDGWYQIKAGEDTGYISEKYVTTEKPAAAPSNPGGSGSTEAVTGKVQMADWWTSNIQTVFKRGRTATVTDVETGISWTVMRSGGTNHADVQPLTAADTAKMKQAYGGSWSWNRRAIWVTIDGVTYAASMNGMPHGTGSITTNNFDGHHCIHFLNSRTHTGNRWDTAHQNAVQKAYKAGQ